MKTVAFTSRRILALMSCSGAMILLSGCVSSGVRTVYTTAQVNQPLRVNAGTVVGVREVVIEGSNNAVVGQIGGAIIGSSAGRAASSGSGRAIAGAVGSVGGMIVGREIEKILTRKPGLEIHIELDNGAQIVIVQEASRGGFEDGDRVRVITGRGTAVVSH